MNTLSEVLSKTKAYHCLECGKCTAVCPLAGLEPSYSPRLLVTEALLGGDGFMGQRFLWSCLTCAACSEKCQSGVLYPQFVRGLRIMAKEQGERGECTHGGALQAIMCLMAKNDLKQDRLGWVGPGLEVKDTSDTLYFVGCLPYFDTLFRDIGFRGDRIARSTIKVLNRLGIRPSVLADERCCGHDLLWQGDLENFRLLAQHNLEAIEKSGAQRVVTACAECYYMLKAEYPQLVGSPKAEVVHISELLAGASTERRKAKKSVTYQDPCRLGRFMGIYDAPREAIAKLAGLSEMERCKASAICCGTSSWTNCGFVNKELQIDRLEEAKATGAELLLTSCPKCQIHFLCAMREEKIIQIQDLAVLAAEGRLSIVGGD
jgi:heterodisulfide reductase subunit D